MVETKPQSDIKIPENLIIINSVWVIEVIFRLFCQDHLFLFGGMSIPGYRHLSNVECYSLQGRREVSHNLPALPEAMPILEAFFL